MDGYKFKNNYYISGKNKDKIGEITRYYNVSHCNLNHVNWLLEEMKRSTE